MISLQSSSPESDSPFFSPVLIMFQSLGLLSVLSACQILFHSQALTLVVSRPVLLLSAILMQAMHYPLGLSLP